MIVQPSAIQRVAAEVARPRAPTTADPKAGHPTPERRPMKLSELDQQPAIIAGLRLSAAIELAYPEQTEMLGDRRASVTLARLQAWREARKLQNRAEAPATRST